MALDINKIISGAVQETLMETNLTPQPPQPLKESVKQKDEPMSESYNVIDSAIPSAISAGLGALALRTRLRSLNEGITDHKKKLAAGALGLLAAGAAAAYGHSHPEEVHNAVNHIKDLIHGRAGGGTGRMEKASEALGSHLSKGVPTQDHTLGTDRMASHVAQSAKTAASDLQDKVKGAAEKIGNKAAEGMSNLRQSLRK